MSVIDKFCNKIGLRDPEEERLAHEEAMLRATELAQKKEEELAAQERVQMNNGKGEDGSRNVVDFQPATTTRDNVVSARMKVMVVEPNSFDDAQLVANNLREKKPVVINFENTEPDDAKRIVDFISGTTYALNGDIKKVGHNVFLCVPNNVNVSYPEEPQKGSSDMPWMKK